MDDLTADVLTQRLDRLERGVHRWRMLVGVASAVLALSLVLNTVVMLRIAVRDGTRTTQDEEEEEEAPVEEEVRAKSFVLVDDEGIPRAALGFKADGTPALAFSDREGRLLWKAP